jgi:hypothetical protein
MSGMEMSKGSKEEIVVTPIRQSCKNVLYFEMVVGLTSAEGFEKSQKRLKVFCCGTLVCLASKGKCDSLEALAFGNASKRLKWTRPRRGQE